MANIYDYLMWRGDISLDERPFNDVDNVILSCLSYFDFTGVVPSEEDGGSISLARACRKLISKGGGDAKQFVRAFSLLDTRFLTLLAESARFESAELCAYCDVYDEKRSLQFAAIQVNLPTSLTYVSYRGTDSTLVGWREDFMLSFQVTEAQRMATEYLNRAIPRATELGNSVMVGGHSKGGNLAVYAAANAPTAVQTRIGVIYNNDGPGFDAAFLDSPGYRAVRERILTLLPQFSIVGTLLEQDSNCTIVRSARFGVAAHDGFNWGVRGTAFLRCDDLSRSSRAFDATMERVLGQMDMDERREFIETLFRILTATGAVTLTDINERRLRKALSIARGMAKEKTVSRFVAEVIEQMVKEYVAVSAEQLRERLPRLRKGKSH